MKITHNHAAGVWITFSESGMYGQGFCLLATVILLNNLEQSHRINMEFPLHRI